MPLIRDSFSKISVLSFIFINMEQLFLEDLSDKIWATKNARFTAYRRMKRCYVSSTIATAMSSANIIAVNMLCYIKTDHVIKYLNNNVAVISIILSVLVLALSLIISLLNYSERSNIYHTCGIMLDSLNQEIQSKIKDPKRNNKEDLTQEMKKDYINRYSDILTKSNLDHSKFDYEYSTFENKKENGQNINFGEYITMWLRWNVFDVNFLYWLIALVPLVLIFIFSAKIML